MKSKAMQQISNPPAKPVWQLGLLSRAELSRTVGVSDTQIRFWIQTKVIPAPKIKHGRRRYWQETQLPALLEAILNRPINRIDEAIRTKLMEMRAESESE